MSDGKRRIDRILEPGYLEALSDKGIDEIRLMRADCSEEEALASYERRLVHGRLAILRKELERRAGSDDSSLIDQLPGILADERRGTRGSFPGHDPQFTYDRPTRHISKLVNDDTLATLPELSDAEVQARIATLEDAEREVSTQRASVLEVLNKLNTELARRYATGQADPSDVLTSG
jgi:hypothetical protein